MRIILFGLILICIFFIRLGIAFGQTESDSLLTKIELLEEKNYALQTQVDNLDLKNREANKLISRERKNLRYLFWAYTIIWAVIFAFVFFQFKRIKHLLLEINLLKNALDED